MYAIDLVCPDDFVRLQPVTQDKYFHHRVRDRIRYAKRRYFIIPLCTHTQRDRAFPPEPKNGRFEKLFRCYITQSSGKRHNRGLEPLVRLKR